MQVTAWRVYIQRVLQSDYVRRTAMLNSFMEIIKIFICIVHSHRNNYSLVKIIKYSYEGVSTFTIKYYHKLSYIALKWVNVRIYPQFVWSGESWPELWSSNSWRCEDYKGLSAEIYIHPKPTLHWLQHCLRRKEGINLRLISVWQISDELKRVSVIYNPDISFKKQ